MKRSWDSARTTGAPSIQPSTAPRELATADALPEIEPLVDSPASDKYGRRIRSLIRLRRERLEIGRALVEINAANWQSLLPYYTDDYEYHDPIVDIYGFDTLVPFFARLFASSPDLVTTVEDEMLIGGVYTATWTMVGQLQRRALRSQGHVDPQVPSLEHTDVLLAGLLQRVRHHGDHPRA
jgi:predicted SnoaL-like aldol condensation-catalyzing enzyme